MKVFVLTGAGISAESGVPTFRGENAAGPWDVEAFHRYSTVGAFEHDPAGVHRFYNGLRASVADPAVAPNAAHRALADLGRTLGADLTLVTQNIDDLHERAGNPSVRHIHGELGKIRSVSTGEVVPWLYDVPETDSAWRPHVVWFGERVLGLAEILQQVVTADVFVAVGTSGTVPPAATLVHAARAAGAYTIEVNIAATPASSVFDRRSTGRASVVVPDLVDKLIKEHHRQARLA